MARDNRGLGLGLALARRLLETHRGSIKADSPDEGQEGHVHNYAVGAFRKQDNHRDAGG
jgi:signal transduction histidine kinase